VTAALRLGGLTPLSTVDFPGRLACVLFVQGCQWRCGYCHNPHLQPRRAIGALTWDSAKAFLERRQGLLDAVVFSGGEPTSAGALPHAVREVRELGFSVGLHTAGAYPERLRALLPMLDWVGLDIKAAPARYDTITHAPGSGARALRSAQILLASGVDCELRTTFHLALLDSADLLALGDALAAMGAQRFALQAFRPLGCIDKALTSVPADVDPAVVRALAARFPQFALRTAH